MEKGDERQSALLPRPCIAPQCAAPHRAALRRQGTYTQPTQLTAAEQTCSPLQERPSNCLDWPCSASCSKYFGVIPDLTWFSLPSVKLRLSRATLSPWSWACAFGTEAPGIWFIRCAQDPIPGYLLLAGLGRALEPRVLVARCHGHGVDGVLVYFCIWIWICKHRPAQPHS